MSPWLNLFILVFFFYTVLRLLGVLFNRLRPPRHAPATGRTWWSRIPKFYRHLITNVGVGGGIFLLLLPFHDYPWLLDIEDVSMDWVMQIRQGVIPFEREKPVRPFILLDIDDETYRDWGEPLFTPRDRLKYLLDTAIKAEPLLIVIDIDVSQKIPLANAPNTALHPDDQALRDYLQTYITDCQAKEKAQGRITCPPIILARAFQNTQSPVLIMRPSFLEETLTSDPQQLQYLQWGSTLFYRSADQVVRRWWLWQPACDDHNQPQVMPSAQLLATALIADGIMQDTQTELAEALQCFKPKDCTHAPESSAIEECLKRQKCSKVQEQSQTLEECLRTPDTHLLQAIKRGISAGPQDPRQRIVYGLPWNWNRPRKQHDPQQPSGSIRHTKTDQSGEIILTVHSAKNFATPTPANLEAKNQVIIIGGSYAEGRDLYVTPLGQMPGMLILTNAIHSLLQYEEVDPLAGWQKLLVEGLLIIIMSIAFAYWESFWAMLFSAILVILVLLPASIFLFRYGYWLDFAIPLLTVFLHELIAEFEKLQKGAREKTKMLD